MAKIKICGLRSLKDIEIVNRYLPDYAGFIINFPKSFRSLNIEELKHLTKQLNPKIQSVGVFVDEDIDFVCSLLKEGIIDMAQLHGNEDEAYIQRVKSFGPVIKAFQIRTKEDILSALESRADYILLDQGKGSGKTFDWSLIPQIERDFFLAGGITIENIEESKRLHPYAIDVSSSVEINQIKDERKVKEMIQKGRTI